MKTCPNCKANLADEARFCLYCMTSLEEKQAVKKSENNKVLWISVSVAVLAILAIVVIFVFSLKGCLYETAGAAAESSNTAALETSSGISITETSSDAPAVQTSSVFSNALDLSSQESSSSSHLELSSNKGSSSNKASSANKSSSSDKSSKPSKPSGDRESSDEAVTSPAVTTSSSLSSETIVTSQTSTSSSYEKESSNTSSQHKPDFEYLEATIEITYPPQSAIYAPQNAVVITKVNRKEQSGNYVIPDKIDGKKVAAIMPSAFDDVADSVKSVTLPASVRTLWSGAFGECVNLKDLYIKSEVIGIYQDAFPENSRRNVRLTIHCKKSCRDYNYYYYKNIANQYNADYQEWNG